MESVVNVEMVIIYNLEFLHLGPKPGIPKNLTVTEISNGFLITWQPPVERANLIQHYSIKYRTDGGWKTLNKAQIRPEDTQYLGNYFNVIFNIKHFKCIFFQLKT